MAEHSKKKRKIWSWIGSILFSLTFLLLAVSYYLSARWNPIVKEHLQSMVVSASDSLYHLEYDDLDLNLVSGSATIKGLRLIPDTILYAQKVAQKTAEDVVYTLEIGKLKVKGVQLRKLFIDKELKIRSIGIEHSTVFLNRFHHKFKDSIPETQKTPLYQIVAQTLKNVKIDDLELSSVNFSLVNIRDSIQKSTVEFQNVRLHVQDIFIDSTAHVDPDRFFYTRSINLNLPAFSMISADSIYQISFDSAYFDSRSSKLTLAQLKVKPILERKAFYQKFGVAKEMINVNFRELIFEKMKLNDFLENQTISAQALKINSGELAVFNDLRFERIRRSKVGKSPHQKLLKLDQKLKIDSVYVYGFDISYSEIGEKFHKEGKITFNRASGLLLNVTNDSIALAQNNWMRADLTAKLMNAGKLRAKFGFDMNSKQGNYTVQGSLGPMKGRVLNQIITPLVNAELVSADIKGLKFDLKGNDYRNEGTLNFDYTDLKFNVLQSDDSGEKSKKGLISFVANQFIVNNSNPDLHGKYLIGKINYRKPAEDSFFKNIWKSLLEGIKISVGINHEKEKKLNNVMNFFKNSFGSQKTKDQNANPN